MVNLNFIQENAFGNGGHFIPASMCQQYVSIGSGDDFAMIKRKAITWDDGNPIQTGH